MTLTLTEETEAQLTAVAAQRGLSPEDTPAQVLAEVEFEETVTGLRQSMAEIVSGDWVALEDFEKAFEEQIRKRRGN